MVEIEFFKKNMSPNLLKEIFLHDKLIEDLTFIIKTYTKNRSPECIHQFILFYNRVCKNLQLDYACYDKYSNLEISRDDYIDLVCHYDEPNPRYVRWLKQICKFIFKCKIPDDLPKKIVYEYKVKPEVKNPYHYMRKEELEELWRVSDDIDKCLMLLLLTTGMRACALAQICKDKIDFEKRCITVFEKGNCVRTYGITEQTMEYLKKTKYFDKEKYVTSLNRRIKNIAKRSNLEKIDHIHPHSFRHTFAKILVEKKIPIEKISLFMGHSNSKITKDVYIQETYMDLVDQGVLPWFKAKNITIIPDFLVLD
jgi:integrase